MSQAENDALLAPFQKIWDQADQARAMGDMLMRACMYASRFEGNEAREDQTALKVLAQRMYAERRRLIDSVPRPGPSGKSTKVRHD